MSFPKGFSTIAEAAKALSSEIKGKIVLITGGSVGGLGAECAATIVKHSPALVILTARSQAKIDEAFAEIKKETPGAPLRPLIVDTSSLKSVREAAKEINSWDEVIDVVIHNAGVASVPLTYTEEGLELVFATNHVGPFLFTKLILPKMLTKPTPPRFVIVASGAHERLSEGFNWSDPNCRQPGSYDMAIYPKSKTLNILFAAALARKSGGKVEAISVTPGWIYTGLSRNLSFEVKRKMGFLDENGNVSDKMDPKGRFASYVVAGFDPKLPKVANGAYLDADGVITEPKPFAKGVDLEEKLWALSEESIGEKFEL
ncbi:hypothetical protein BCR39DRAFT_548791 [Naematelia encephala]|uniref:Short-chain dehydrogenase n=1 Tax=Naematelia encephala TaxID=71784 RepID=A0A1Y2AMH5_9TREE|nr:hypothetical protein BCR39DRAFT_548791 [Naematelia encephala]